MTLDEFTYPVVMDVEQVSRIFRNIQTILLCNVLMGLTLSEDWAAFPKIRAYGRPRERW